MERKEIKINFERSGVKTLSGFGTCFIILGIFSLLSFLFSLIVEESAVLSISLFVASIGLFSVGAICKGLSGIARSVLYKKEVLRQEYRFITD